MEKLITGIHHVTAIGADAPDKTTQTEVRTRIIKRMLNSTPFLNRNYFTSIYFREPGSVLLEVATAGPGFTIDESKDHLGETLQLSAQFEPDREKIEKVLKPIQLDLKKYR